MIIPKTWISLYLPRQKDQEVTSICLYTHTCAHVHTDIHIFKDGTESRSFFLPFKSSCYGRGILYWAAGRKAPENHTGFLGTKRGRGSSLRCCYDPQGVSQKVSSLSAIRLTKSREVRSVDFPVTAITSPALSYLVQEHLTSSLKMAQASDNPPWPRHSQITLRRLCFQMWWSISNQSPTLHASALAKKKKSSPPKTPWKSWKWETRQPMTL